MLYNINSVASESPCFLKQHLYEKAKRKGAEHNFGELKDAEVGAKLANRVYREATTPFKEAMMPAEDVLLRILNQKCFY